MHSTQTPSSRRRNHLLWLGPAIVLLGAISYFTYFAFFPALRDFPWVNLPLVLAGVALSGLALWRSFAHPEQFRGKILGSVGLLFSIALGGLYTAYIFHLSYELPAPTELALGLVEAPDFTLPDHEGRLVHLAELRGRNVVLVFYRGYW